MIERCLKSFLRMWEVKKQRTEMERCQYNVLEVFNSLTVYDCLVHILKLPWFQSINQTYQAIFTHLFYIIYTSFLQRTESMFYPSQCLPHRRCSKRAKKKLEVSYLYSEYLNMYKTQPRPCLQEISLLKHENIHTLCICKVKGKMSIFIYLF